jgi:GNAT superfamily N-acetyltransferase
MVGWRRGQWDVYRRRVERDGSSPLMPPIRRVRTDELALLPDLEATADTAYERLGVGPLPGPGTEEEFAAALVVLVAGDPPVGLCRIDGITNLDSGEVAAHLEQLAVHPDHGRRGLGRALLRAGCAWAAGEGYDTLTLATYRDVPWNGPFYASEGFVEVGPVDDWLVAHGRRPEEPVMSRFGVRVLMRRPL